MLNCEDRRDENNNKIKIFPYCIIIPLYHKIRYPYHEIVKKLCVLLDKIISSGIISKKSIDMDSLEWDIYLTSINKIKNIYLDDNFYHNLPNGSKERLLLGYFPKYIWRCILKYKDSSLIEILGDATEAQTQFPFFLLFSQRKSILKALNSLFSKKNMTEWLEIVIEFYN